MTDQALDAAVAKLTDDGAAPSVIAAFVDRYARFAGGETGYLREADIRPLTDPPQLEDLPMDSGAVDALAQTAVVRLNGGLGTSMGLAGPKCLIPVREGLTFLDIVVRQMLALRAEHGVRLPLLLMDSYNTSADTLAALQAYWSYRWTTCRSTSYRAGNRSSWPTRACPWSGRPTPGWNGARPATVTSTRPCMPAG